MKSDVVAFTFLETMEQRGLSLKFRRLKAASLLHDWRCESAQVSQRCCKAEGNLSI